jgi:hypothetical protein
LVIRDANGRAQVNAPSGSLDVANKAYVDSAVGSNGGSGGGVDNEALEAHIAETNVHGATVEPTPMRLVMRDEYGRAQVSTPITAYGAANKKYVDDNAGNPNAIISVSMLDAYTLRFTRDNGQSFDLVIKNAPASNWTAIVVAGEEVSATFSNAFYCVCYGAGLFVAGTGLKSFYTSPDGITWTERQTSLTSATWKSICFGNGTFVAVSSGNQNLVTSPDGLTWTMRSIASVGTDWWGVCFGNGTFVAVGPNQVMTSTNGTSWTKRTSAVNATFVSVCYGNGLFVAVSTTGSGRCMTSPDGITWTAQDTPNNNQWECVCCGAGLFVAISGMGEKRLMTSPDGINWTERTVPLVSWRSVCYNDGLFVAVGTNAAMTSTDGINWKSVGSPGSAAWAGVCYGNGLFVAVAFNGTKRIAYAPAT